MLLPQPQRMVMNPGVFSLRDATLVIGPSCDYRMFEITKMLREEIFNATGVFPAITKALNHAEKGNVYIKQESEISEAYKLIIEPTGVRILGEGYAGVFYAVQTLIQIIRQQGVELKCLSIEDFPAFKNRGFLLDVTRGSIPTLETLMGLVDKLSFLKINQLQLYIEHSYAFSRHSEVWTGQDVLSAEDIIALDEYCKRRCIELVPCMQTFGHLYHVLTSESYRELCELDGCEEEFSWCGRMHHHTLNVSDPRSFDFVKEMLNEFIPLFSSNKFNICCDETFDLGKGKSDRIVREKGVEKVYYDFFMQVYRYVAGKGKQVMLWGDMILSHPELLKKIPEEAVILNWDYSLDAEENGVKKLAQANLKQYVCPGTQAWNALVPNFKALKHNISKMVAYGSNYHVEGVLNTNWGDYGNINLLSSSLPGMAYGAALSWNNADTFGLGKEFNRELSFFMLGDRTYEIADLLEKLSGYEVVKWGDIVNWLEKDSIQEFDWVSKAYRKRLESWTQNSIKMAYESILGCVDEISNLGGSIENRNKIDFLEIEISARGTALMQLVGQLILKEEKRIEQVQWIVPPTELAVLLEEWFNWYASIWRMRNRESELYRLRNAILKISKIARNIDRGC